MGKGEYETFDSGSGKLIPPGEKDNFAHEDSGKDAEPEAEDLAVPTMPQKR